jgi:hypothetical protein
VGVAEHDPAAFADLFESEPDDPSEAEKAEWVNLYARLVDLLERQLAETERFAGGVPDGMRRYLHGENRKILVEELEIFRDRLAHWRAIPG